MYETYKDAGLMPLAVYSSNNEGVLPDAEDLTTWANYYGIQTPVLADANSTVYSRYGTGSIPVMALLGPGMEVLELGSIYEDTIEGYLGGE